MWPGHAGKRGVGTGRDRFLRVPLSSARAPLSRGIVRAAARWTSLERTPGCHHGDGLKLALEDDSKPLSVLV